VSRISQAFARAREEERGALVVYITAGDPNLQTTRELVPVIARAGADVIELGMPYSDPIADGPVIQAAGQRALQAGTTLEGVLEMVGQLRQRTDVPLVFMTCYNPILHYGPEKFAAAAAEAGLDGVLISDLPAEEAEQWAQTAWARELDTIFLVAPTTPPERARFIASLCRGFVYMIARAGVTGVGEELAPEAVALVEELRKATDVPVALGFGIRTPEQVAAACKVADAAIVGSAVVEVIGRLGGAEDLFYAVGGLVGNLAKATRRR